MEDNIFDIAFTWEGRNFKGWVNPSDKLNGQGVPSSFHVVINDISFGYLSFSDCKWTAKEERPEGLIKMIGRQIEIHYQF